LRQADTELYEPRSAGQRPHAPDFSAAARAARTLNVRDRYRQRMSDSERGLLLDALVQFAGLMEGRATAVASDDERVGHHRRLVMKMMNPATIAAPPTTH
jgi:hypothetical protein